MKSGSCRNEVVHSGEVKEDSLAKEVKIRPPIGLALEHFQPIDLALHLPIIPLVDKRRLHRRAIPAQPTGKTLHFQHRALQSLREPLAKAGQITGPQQVAKVSYAILGLLDGRRHVPQAGDIGLLPGILFTSLGDRVVIQQESQDLTRGEEALWLVVARSSAGSSLWLPWPQSPAGKSSPDQSATAGKALLANLSVQPGAVVFSLSPALPQVEVKWVQDARMPWLVPSLGECVRSGEPGHRLPAQANTPGNGSIAISLGLQGLYFLVARPLSC